MSEASEKATDALIILLVQLILVVDVLSVCLVPEPTTVEVPVVPSVEEVAEPLH